MAECRADGLEPGVVFAGGSAGEQIGHAGERSGQYVVRRCGWRGAAKQAAAKSLSGVQLASTVRRVGG
jgi:hypothetical protein